MNSYKYKQQKSPNLQDGFLKDPLITTIKLARYKFPAKMLSLDDDVLDLGCGSGFGTYFYATHTNGHVTGIDANSETTRNNETFQRKNLSFIQADITSPPAEITTQKYNVITSVDVIEHFDRGTGIEILNNYAKLIESGGMMITGTPNVHSTEYRSESSKKVHIYEYDPEELREIMNDLFDRVLYFSMNDEIVHTGHNKMAWFFYLIAFKA
jgi:cyclopropane fatty-acyl-phospholipid synthase-like methyltransferase